MPYRVTDSTHNARIIAQIAQQRQRVATAQEQIASGKRINRPSDDPAGTEAVIRFRASQSELEGYRKNASLVNDKLTNADGLVSDFQLKLDRIRTILSQGISDTSTQEAKNNLAIEIDSLRQQVLNLSNSTVNGEYVFGGTRQNAPPFDPATATPAATATLPQLVQIEPNTTPVATGVTAETLFSDVTGTIFAELTSAAAALRGTGDPVADKATLRTVQDRIAVFSNQASNALGQIGATQRNVEDVLSRLDRTYLALEESVHNTEGADFAESAIKFTEAQQALEATLQSSASFNRRTLLDFLG